VAAVDVKEKSPEDNGSHIISSYLCSSSLSLNFSSHIQALCFPDSDDGPAFTRFFAVPKNFYTYHSEGAWRPKKLDTAKCSGDKFAQVIF
jgi:hypothetical protein